MLFLRSGALISGIRRGGARENSLSVSSAWAKSPCPLHPALGLASEVQLLASKELSDQNVPLGSAP